MDSVRRQLCASMIKGKWSGFLWGVGLICNAWSFRCMCNSSSMVSPCRYWMLVSTVIWDHTVKTYTIVSYSFICCKLVIYIYNSNVILLIWKCVQCTVDLTTHINLILLIKFTFKQYFSYIKNYEMVDYCDIELYCTGFNNYKIHLWLKLRIRSITILHNEYNPVSTLFHWVTYNWTIHIRKTSEER